MPERNSPLQTDMHVILLGRNGTKSIAAVNAIRTDVPTSQDFGECSKSNLKSATATQTAAARVTS